jgi:hypothetical protein
LGFRVSTPDGIIELDYNSKMTYNDKLEKVNDLLLQYDDYLSKYRKSKNAKKMLFDLSSYLLKGENTNQLSYKKSKSVKLREIPVSNVKNQSIKDLLYSGRKENMDFGEYEDEFVSVDQHFIDYEEQLVDEMYSFKKTKTQIEKWENTSTHKLNKLRSSYDKYKYVTDNKVITYKFDNKEDLQKFLDNTPKFTNSIKPKKILVHKGHRGLIEKTDNYTAAWVNVDTDNIFKFLGDTYKISDELSQYQLNNDTYLMTSVLCYYIKNKDEYHFFDQNIEEITNYVVKII